jgi:hypothetical protein
MCFRFVSLHAIQTIQADATKYTKPESWSMHLLITETMFQALCQYAPIPKWEYQIKR